MLARLGSWSFRRRMGSPLRETCCGDASATVLVWQASAFGHRSLPSEVTMVSVYLIVSELWENPGVGGMDLMGVAIEVARRWLVHLTMVSPSIPTYALSSLHRPPESYRPVPSSRPCYYNRYSQRLGAHLTCPFLHPRITNPGVLFLPLYLSLIHI